MVFKRCIELLFKKDSKVASLFRNLEIKLFLYTFTVDVCMEYW